MKKITINLIHALIYMALVHRYESIKVIRSIEKGLEREIEPKTRLKNINNIVSETLNNVSE